MDEALAALLSLLSERLREELTFEGGDCTTLTEIVLDQDRPMELRFLDGAFARSSFTVSAIEIANVIKGIPAFGSDDRSGLSGTLHRISCIRDRQDSIIGLTIRIGRIVEQPIELIADILDSDESVLIIGPPGKGKTTLLRQSTRYLADGADKRVMVVDTSNELGGDGTVPHAAIGSARRMMVPQRNRQYEVMCMAVANHTPEVLVVDEILTRQEAESCCSVAERGVQLLATVHGKSFESVIRNKNVNEILGKVLDATVSDKTAEDNGGNKIVLTRRNSPAFTKVIEIVDFGHIYVYHDVEATVDAILTGKYVKPEVRYVTPDGKVEVRPGLITEDQPATDKVLNNVRS